MVGDVHQVAAHPLRAVPPKVDERHEQRHEQPRKLVEDKSYTHTKKKDGLLIIGDILSRVAVRRLLIDDTCIESIALISVANKTRQKTQRAINYFTLNIFTSLAS